MAAVSEAIDGLMQFRAKEGVKLTEFFTRRIENIRALIAGVEPYEKERVAKIRARIEDTTPKINGVSSTHNRLDQDMIFYT